MSSFGNLEQAVQLKTVIKTETGNGTGRYVEMCHKQVASLAAVLQVVLSKDRGCLCQCQKEEAHQQSR